ncbi:glycosyltransferase family 2 protein [Agromyces badenianii]|uniref:glycosyltransferase family 2 protein n=1 Tax=Agromyces badenianii TaxID=2080742 RepID=UPI0014054133|nr:glycosyltransferase family 2 protein [Agromyces badenianii]
MPAVFAVVPTFNPDAEAVDRLSVLSAQVDHVIVVDDGSSPVADPVLAAIVEAGHELVRSGSNRGIAAALNSGIELALERNADYVLTMDQDSILADGYVEACLAAFDLTVPATRLGIVLSDRVNGLPAIPARRSPEGLGLVDEGIQSGALVSAECLRVAGLMDESLVIDCVDTEFCLRAADAGFKLAVAPGTDMQHSLGHRAPLRPFGVQLRHGGRIARYQYHSPFRQYYIVRNNIDLILRNASRRPRWVGAVVKRELGPRATTIVSGPHRLRQVLAVLVGTVHGLVRRRGKIPGWLARALAIPPLRL